MTTTWTKIAKPTDGSSQQTIAVGNPIGLLLALTYAQASSVAGVSNWTKISKAT